MAGLATKACAAHTAIKKGQKRSKKVKKGQKITTLPLSDKNSNLDRRKNIKKNNLRSMDMNMYGK